MDYVDYARSWINTPFRHQGRLPGVGLDCAGLVICALAAAGKNVQDLQSIKGYPRIPSNGQFMRAVRSICYSVDQPTLVRGDLLTFIWRVEPQHIAIWTGNSIIHAYQEIKQVTEHDLDQLWQQRLSGCWRLKETV